MVDITKIIGNTEDENLDLNRNRIFLINLDEVQENKENPYQCTEIESLAENIETQGIVTPATAYRDGENIVLLSGHRRKKAMQYLVNSGKKYSFNGQDITGKMPVIFSKKPIASSREILQIISANAQRDMTNKEKNNVIDQAKEAIETLCALGAIAAEKGMRKAAVISSYTGIKEHYVKDYLASQNRAEGTIAGDPETEEKDRQSAEVSEEVKMFKKHKKCAEQYIKVLKETRYQSLDEIEQDELKGLGKQIKELLEKLEW